MTKHNKSNYSVPYFKVRHVPVQIDLHPPEPGAVPGDEEDVPRQRLPLLVGVVQVLVVQVLGEVLHLGIKDGRISQSLSSWQRKIFHCHSVVFEETGNSLIFLLKVLLQKRCYKFEK